MIASKERAKPEGSILQERQFSEAITIQIISFAEAVLAKYHDTCIAGVVH